MNRQDVGSTVLLSEAEDGAAMTADLALRALPATCYPTVADLIQDRPLSSVAVLIMRSPPLPNGRLLVNLAWLNVEYPWMQKLMVVDGMLPLPMAEYLTACGVELVRCKKQGPAGADQLASVVNRLRERNQWLTPRWRSRSTWSSPSQ